MSLTAPCYNLDHLTLGPTAKALNPVWAAWEMLVDPPANASPEYMARWRKALADALASASQAMRPSTEAGGHSCALLGVHAQPADACGCPCLDCKVYRESAISAE